MSDFDDVTDIANAIESVCAGRSTVAVYTAIAMVLGNAEAQARKPDLDGLMAIMGEAARHYFENARRQVQ